MIEVPGTKVVDLIGSAASLGEQNFIPASATTLTHATKYFVLFRTSASAETTDCKLGRTNSGHEDDGAASGWHMAGRAIFSPDSGETWTDTASFPEDPPPPIKIAIRGTFIQSGTPPDLVVGSASVSDDSPETGGSFTLSATVTNSGDGAAAATTLRYYHSTDATISTSDTGVGTDAVGALAAGGTSDESIALTAPASAGTYYYGACVDAVPGESETTNNCSSSVQVDVSGGGGGGNPSMPGAPASLTATAGDEEVALVWSAPADNGGAPITGYEYRHAAGGSVPEDTPWESAGLTLEATVTGLTNGRQYAFEVRARNNVGAGEARGALATPLGPPDAPASLAATAGDEEVRPALAAPGVRPHAVARWRAPMAPPSPATSTADRDGGRQGCGWSAPVGWRRTHHRCPWARRGNPPG